LQVHHLVPKGSGGNLGHTSRLGSQDHVWGHGQGRTSGLSTGQFNSQHSNVLDIS